MLDAFRDLVLGSACVGCGRPGPALCGPCRAEVEVRPRPAWPTPVPPGLRDPWAASSYDGTVRSMVLALKEHRRLALVGPLAAMLAAAAAAALAQRRLVGAPVVLVPVPSRPSTLRQRGHDPTTSLVQEAARLLDTSSRPVRCAPMLRTRPGLADQSELGAQARAANLADAFRVSPAALRRLARRGGAVHLLVCDDVLTTGSTAAEAQRALRAVGLPPLAVVAVAATRLRTGGGGPSTWGEQVSRSPPSG